MDEFLQFITKNEFTKIGKSNGYIRTLGHFEFKIFNNNNRSYTVQVRRKGHGFPYYNYEQKRIISVDLLKAVFEKQLDIVSSTQWK